MQKTIAIALCAALVIGLALGLSLGLTLPIKSVTAEGEAILLAGEPYEGGLFLSVKRRSGKETRMEVKPYMLSSFDSAEEGERDVTVTYKDRKIPAKIRVVALSETVCAVREGSMKTQYEPKEEVSTSGILDLYYNNTPFRSFPITPEMIEGFDSSLSGDYEARVVFRGEISCVYRYTVMKRIKSLQSVGKLYAEQGAPLTKENVMGSGVISVTYTDDTSETVSLYNEFVSILTQKLEERDSNYQTTIELSYRGETFEFEAEAYLKGQQFEVESLLLSLPKTVYKVGESVPLESVVLSAKYKYYDGFALVSVSPSMVSHPGAFEEPASSLTFTVTYRNRSISETLRVVSEEEAAQITSIATDWRGSPDGSLSLGDELNFEGAVLTVTRGYGYSTQKIPLTAEMVSGYDPSTPGAQTLTLSYEGVIGEVWINVVSQSDSDLVTKIESVSGWQDLTYKTDPALVLPEDAGILVEFGYGARRELVPLTADGVSISGFSPGVAGRQTLTISYKGKSVSLDIIVKDDTVEGLTGISVSAAEYKVGEEFDPERCLVSLEYASGKTAQQKTLAELMELGATYETDFNGASAGSYYVTVVFGDFSAGNWIYVRTVGRVASGLNLDVSGGKTVYSVGEALDLTGIELYVNYSDGSAEKVTLTFDMVANFDTATAGGPFFATVSYDGMITNYAYTVE